MRSKLALALVMCLLAGAPTPPAHAVPGICPPICDAIPDAAWIAPTAIPLDDLYHWPDPAGVAVTARAPRFAFEEACASPPLPADVRDYAVAARADVTNPDGQWQLRTQILHWRGPTAQGGPTASAALETARARLRDCQLTAPAASPSFTVNEAQRIATVISVAGSRQMRQYLLADPANSTVVSLSMWSALPLQVRWPTVSDVRTLDAMAAPLCDAYIGSCR
ncbi:ATPase [Mycolicibacterium sp. XJ1819]